jgi:predicted ArsR family transcriptional regulator
VGKGEDNRSRILAYLREQAPLSVSELCQALDLTSPTVSRHLSFLLVQRLVALVDPPMGRRERLYVPTARRKGRP